MNFTTKFFNWSLILLLGLAAFSSCEQDRSIFNSVAGDSMDIDPDSLPNNVLNFISTNYPNDDIYEAELDDECGMGVYEVELSNGLELYFDLQGNFLGTDDTFDCDDDHYSHYIHPDSLPANVLTYISTNYPNDSIYEAELDDECDMMVYEVELSNGIELYFDLQGNFLGTDDSFDCDDDGHDDDIHPDSLPANIITYISSNYPNDSIYEAELDDECGVMVYEVELSNGIELYFDLQGNFLGTDDSFDCDDDDIHPDSLPANIITYISSNYPNDSIYEAEIDDECDEDVYEVELSSGVELYFDMQGNFLGTDDTYDCDDDPITLPASVLNYISTNYPNDSIYEAEIDDECDEDVYKVELNSGLELYFDMQGNFLGTDDTYDCDD